MDTDETMMKVGFSVKWVAMVGLKIIFDTNY